MPKKRPFSSIYEDFAASPSQSTEPFNYNYTTFIESCWPKGFPVVFKNIPLPVIREIEEQFGVGEPIVLEKIEEKLREPIIIEKIKEQFGVGEPPIVIETATRISPQKGRYESMGDYIERGLEYLYKKERWIADLCKRKHARTDDPDPFSQLEISGPPEQVDLVKDLVSSPPEQLDLSGPFSQLEISGPPEQFEIVPFLDFPIGNLYFSFTNSSLFMLLTLSLVLLLVYFVTQKNEKEDFFHN